MQRGKELFLKYSYAPMRLCLYVSIFLLCLFTNGCSKPKTMILFNQVPITKETLLNNSNEFIAGKRFYYIFITEKPLKTNFVRVRVLKRDDKARGEITKLYYSKDFRLYKDQIYYYNDYLVINEAGTYCMAVYALDGLNRPLAVADFKIQN